MATKEEKQAIIDVCWSKALQTASDLNEVNTEEDGELAHSHLANALNNLVSTALALEADLRRDTRKAEVKAYTEAALKKTQDVLEHQHAALKASMAQAAQVRQARAQAKEKADAERKAKQGAKAKQ